MSKVRSIGMGVVAAVAVGLLGCAADDDTTPHPVPPDSEDEVACPADTPQFSAAPGTGLLVMGNHQSIQGRVVAAQPLRPERYYNDWTVAFSDAQGKPLDDMIIANACAFMRVHGHGMPPRSATQLTTDRSNFALMHLNLFMRGPWEVQLAVSSPSIPGTATEYTSCDSNRRAPGNELLIFRTCITDANN